MKARDETKKSIEREIQRLLRAAGQSGNVDFYKGKRKAARIACTLQLEVTTDPAISSAVWVAAMHDISGGGLSFWSKRELRSHAMIHVREFSPDRQRPWLPAAVTHCTIGLRGYLIGAAFEPAGSGAPQGTRRAAPVQLPHGVGAQRRGPRS